MLEEKNLNFISIVFFELIWRVFEIMQDSNKNSSVEENFKFEDFFVSEKFWEFFGHPILRRVESSRDKYAKLIFKRSHIGYIVNLFMLAISFIFFAIERKFMFAIEGLMISFALFCVFVYPNYLIYFIWKSICDTIDKLQELFPNSRSDQNLCNASKYHEKIKKVRKIIVIVYMIALFEFVSLGPEIKIYGWITSKTVQWEPIMNLKLPFDDQNPKNYIPIQIFLTWISTQFTYTLITLDIFYTDVLIISCMLFDLLKAKIINFRHLNDLKELFRYHNQLIWAANNLNKFFTIYTFVNIFGSIVACCVGSFIALVRTWEINLKGARHCIKGVSKVYQTLMQCLSPIPVILSYRIFCRKFWS